MSDTAFDDDVYVAVMHRADAPAGRTARFHMRELFDNLPCCRRSSANQGKRFFLHGYERTFEIEFACAETESDTVVASSAVREIRAALRCQFDHTTLIAVEDPQRDLFELLAERGVIDLRIMDNTGDGGLGGLGVRHRRADRRAGERRPGLGVASKGPREPQPRGHADRGTGVTDPGSSWSKTTKLDAGPAEGAVCDR
ncbi:MAG TPA: 6-carboxytetrahydropterin synthase, partial [Mycobacterium sp.]|nr:6-carboxytetrahydropterin synthase [Mycobacterium sp.]